MTHVLPRCGDPRQGGVVVHAKMRARDSPVPRGYQCAQSRPAVDAEDGLRRFDHELDPDRSRPQAELPFEPAAYAIDDADMGRSHDLGNRDGETRRETLTQPA